MTVIAHATPAPPRGVRVEPVGASLRETGYAATPELAVWVDQRSGRTWLALRFGRVLLEVELEPGQVDTVTAGLLDEVPVPYELTDQGAEPRSDDDRASRRPDGKPETDADRRFFNLRESGYTGWIDQDGYAVDQPTGNLGESRGHWVGWW